MSDHITAIKNVYSVNGQSAVSANAAKKDLENIIGNMPSWIFRWGMISLFGLLFSLMAGAYFFRYSDVVTARCIINLQRSSNAIATVDAGHKHQVAPGEKVMIKLAAYPYEDYGTLNGEVIAVSIRKDGQVNVSIHLPAGRTTTKGLTIANMERLDGTAEIFTAEKSVLIRMVNKLRSEKMKI